MLFGFDKGTSEERVGLLSDDEKDEVVVDFSRNEEERHPTRHILSASGKQLPLMDSSTSLNFVPKRTQRSESIKNPISPQQRPSSPVLQYDSTAINISESDEDDSDFQRRFFYFAPESENQDPNYVYTETDLPSKPKLWKSILMICLPCLVGNPCTKERRVEYRKAATTMVMFISAVQFIMFLVEVGIGGVENPSNNWLIGPGSQALIDCGAKDVKLIRQNYEVYRFITPVFLNAGFIEIFLNLFAQIRLGIYLERQWGWLKFTTIYFVSGVGGIVLSCIAQPNSISVAASSSLIGIMGAYLAHIGMTWHKMDSWQRKVNLAQCAFVITMVALEGIGPDYVDSSSHLGAVVMGLALAYSIFGREYARKESILANVLPFISWLAILVYFAGAFVLFYTIVLLPPVVGT